MLRADLTLLWMAVALLLAPGGAAAVGAPQVRYVHASWTMQHGLPTSAITALAQDADGYLWLGSFAGLIRFDGVRFVHWSTIGSPSLPESLIHALTVARDGSLWIGFGNMGGVGRIQGETLRVYPSGQGLPDGSIQSIVEDRD